MGQWAKALWQALAPTRKGERDETTALQEARSIGKAVNQNPDPLSSTKGDRRLIHHLMRVELMLAALWA
jgi:hypothetical protein